jgi:hypothetical protein
MLHKSPLIDHFDSEMFVYENPTIRFTRGPDPVGPTHTQKMSIPGGFVLLVEAEFEKHKQNPSDRTLLKVRDAGALMVERTQIQTLEVYLDPRHE